MGVYIKDMEIPKSCRDCDIGFTICNRYYDPNFGINDARIKRHPDCPLVEVKAPHGRLIDEDAVYDAVERRYRVSSGAEHRAERDFLDLISNAPTIIEAEEKDDG